MGANLQAHTGFLGATRDDSSGYQPLGARLYDPVVGRFLSADPVLDLNDLLQSNGYAYAHNNPVTMSDPTGLAISLTASERAAALAGAGLSAAQVAQAQATMGKSLSSVILGAAWSTLKDFIGINDAMACFGGDMWSCAGMVLGAIPWFKAGKIPGVLKAIDRTIDAIQAFRKAKKAAEAVLRAAKAAETAALKAKKAAIEKAKKEAAQRAKKKAAEQAKRTSDKAVAQTKKTGNPVQKQAQAKAAPKASSVSKGSGGGKGGGSKPGGDSGGSSRSKGGSSESGDSGKADGGGGESCDVANSFVPGTKILMADGSSKPIEEVEVGDKVLATDPQTGETRIETVTAEIKGKGLKHLVKVVIDTDGDKGEATAEVTATDGHPFWVPELGQWLDATDLQPGQWLQPAPARTSRSPRSNAGPHRAPPSTTSPSATPTRTMCWRGPLRSLFTTATRRSTMCLRGPLNSATPVVNTSIEELPTITTSSRKRGQALRNLAAATATLWRTRVTTRRVFSHRGHLTLRQRENFQRSSVVRGLWFSGFRAVQSIQAV